VQRFRIAAVGRTRGPASVFLDVSDRRVESSAPPINASSESTYASSVIGQLSWLAEKPGSTFVRRYTIPISNRRRNGRNLLTTMPLDHSLG